MKTMAANLGLGDATRARRAEVLRGEAKQHARPVTKREWRAKRIAFFQHNCRFAASAKATRAALNVTQAEVAKEFGVSQGTVCNWESGKYAWQGDAGELQQYLQVVARISRR